MLRIRSEQLIALRAPLHAELATRLVAHVREHFAERTRALSDARLHAHLLAGIERCDGYGITAARDVARFVNLMAAFGWEFDRELGWAADVLQRSAGRDRRPKLDRLVDAAALRQRES